MFLLQHSCLYERALRPTAHSISLCFQQPAHSSEKVNNRKIPAITLTVRSVLGKQTLLFSVRAVTVVSPAYAS